MLINKGVSNGEYKGMQINHRAPVFTHLMFADDFFLFGEASFSMMDKIKETFNLYGSFAGQLVNFSKSSILFSKNLSHTSLI